MGRVVILKNEIKDGLSILKHAYDYYDKIEECDEIKQQINYIFVKYKRMLTLKKIPKKRYTELLSYLEAIQSFRKFKIYTTGEPLL
jgi:hypothetical protein